MKFEIRDEVPGLAFSKDGWTPVVHRKKRRRIRKMTTATCRSTEAEFSEELETCVRKAKQVMYQIRDSTV